jgi:hypothetical protein
MKLQNHQPSVVKEDTWREISILLIRRVERSKSKVVRICEVRTREKITVVDRSEIIETVHHQGHVVRDQRFVES